MELTQSLLLIIGFLLASGLFYGLLFFGFQREWGLLFLSFFCFGQAGKAFFRPDAGLAMAQLGFSEAHSLSATHACYLLGGYCLLAFVTHYFDLAHRRWWLLFFALSCTLLYALRLPSLPFILAAGLSVSLYHIRVMPRASGWVSIGLVLFGILTLVEHQLISHINYFLGTLTFILAISIMVGIRLRTQIRLQREILVRSVRLENQLLKRSLQPHFLLNSLMSLQEWIETSPEQAAVFVQALGEEFRALCRISGKSLVPITEELAMCRAHLTIMGYRKQASFQLETRGISGQEQVPPAIFHTLIENGLTHGFSDQKTGFFRITKKNEHGGCVYSVSNNGHSQTPSEQPAPGTGIKYIESQLESSFPGSWALESSVAEDGGWQVTIRINAHYR